MSKDISEAELGSFIAAAGNSLTSAQGQLATGLDIQTGLVLSNAEIEARVGVKTDAQGKLNIQTISAQDIRQGGLNVDALSTVKISFVATAIEGQSQPLQATGPVRTKEDVIGEMRKQPGLAALDKILGGLQYNAVFIPENARWLVTVIDTNQRVVREAILLDK